MVNTLLTFVSTKTSHCLDDMITLIDKGELVSADIQLDTSATLSVHRYGATFEEGFNFTLVSNDEFFDMEADILFGISPDKVIGIVHEFITDYVGFLQKYNNVE